MTFLNQRIFSTAPNLNNRAIATHDISHKNKISTGASLKAQFRIPSDSTIIFAIITFY